MTKTPAETGLRAVVAGRPVFFLPRDDVAGELLIPSLKAAMSFDCMTGFFTSSSVRQLAPGLAEFIERREGRMRLLISPHLALADQEALVAGATTPAGILEKVILELLGTSAITASALAVHTLKCIAYLISVGRLEVKVGLISGALFHPKVWILSSGRDTLVAHGSVNMTEAGISRNFEHITVARSWADPEQSDTVRLFVAEFCALWHSRRPEAVVVDLPTAIREHLLRAYSATYHPSPSDYAEACRVEHDGEAGRTDDQGDVSPATEVPSLRIPKELEISAGDYSHQGAAVAAWAANGRRGILEMATGSGKTITALVAATELARDNPGLLVVIAVPYKPLLHQWAAEVRRFGVEPSLPSLEATRRKKLALVEADFRLTRFARTAAVEVVSHDLLCDAEYRALLRGRTGPTFLIADEVHNLGIPGFLEAPPTFIAYRLGLSATPIRQYDDVGTAGLLAYFGPIVFEFTLNDAIGRCLVPYDYHVIPVTLTGDEASQWEALTLRIQRLAAMGDRDPSVEEKLRFLLLRRRKILENADEKLRALEQLIDQLGPRRVRHTLMYASDKAPQQLAAVNALLGRKGVSFHQITCEESGDTDLTETLLRKFRTGDLQVLTAKRVLDEGVNIPEVVCGILLASTTVERQWIQRRGRLLRRCAAIEKGSSDIWDFVVLPPTSLGPLDPMAKSMIRGELERAMAFAALSRNFLQEAGANDTLGQAYRILVPQQ